jgi:hypothetical protein
VYMAVWEVTCSFPSFMRFFPFVSFSSLPSSHFALWNFRPTCFADSTQSPVQDCKHSGCYSFFCHQRAKLVYELFTMITLSLIWFGGKTAFVSHGSFLILGSTRPGR